MTLGEEIPYLPSIYKQFYSLSFHETHLFISVFIFANIRIRSQT